MGASALPHCAARAPGALLGMRFLMHLRAWVGTSAATSVARHGSLTARHGVAMADGLRHHRALFTDHDEPLPHAVGRGLRGVRPAATPLLSTPQLPCARPASPKQFARVIAAQPAGFACHAGHKVLAGRRRPRACSLRCRIRLGASGTSHVRRRHLAEPAADKVYEPIGGRSSGGGKKEQHVH